MLCITVHLQIMDSRIHHHLPCFIEIVISVQRSPVQSQIVNIPYLRCCAELSQIVDKVKTVQLFLFLIFISRNTFQMLHVGTASLEFAICIMVIVTVKHRSIYFKIIKIMNFCCCASAPINIQTVEAITFHHIFSAAIFYWLDLCLFCY